MAVYIIAAYYQSENHALSPEDRCHEIKELARAIDQEVFGIRFVDVKKIKAATYLSAGVLEEIATEIATEIADKNLDFVIVDANLSATQQRNIEKILKVFVEDRSSLIIQIFASRARSEEGKLQVALARLRYDASRLVRSWTHLERQRGGLGKTGGPGERQIELDRRLIDENIKKLEFKLEQIRKKRLLHRHARAKIPIPVVALVGYTNAGKTTLFNMLTKSQDFADNKVFATLDTHHRHIILPSGRRIILSDTVGFIHDLPHHLVAAFRATLEELETASLILHIGDLSHANLNIYYETGDNLLASFDIERTQIKKIGNKCDLADHNHNFPVDCAISGQENINIQGLLNLIDDYFNDQESVEQQNILVKHINSALIQAIYQLGAQIQVNFDENNPDYAEYTMNISAINWQKLKSIACELTKSEK